MKKVFSIILLVMLNVIMNVGTTYALNSWNTSFLSTTTNISLGNWTWETSIIYPNGVVDLNHIIDNNLNNTLYKGEYFIYNGNLYVVIAETGYNILWHGIPSGSSAGWAFLSLSLDWMGAQQRYEIGTVVRVGSRYFQAIHLGNTNNPTTNNGPLTSGKPWREIQPMDDHMFPLIPGTTLRNYGAPIPEYIVPM